MPKINTITGEVIATTEQPDNPHEWIETSRLKAALWVYFSKGGNGMTWLEFAEKSRFAHGFNQLWCLALGLNDWRNGTPRLGI